MEEGLSFAAKVKEEICLSSWEDVQKRAILSSFIRINGYLKISSNRTMAELSTESAFIAKAIYQFIYDIYGIKVKFSYTRSSGLLKRVTYHIIIVDEAEDVLNDLGVDLLSGEMPDNPLISNDEYFASYLSGAFLASGSVNDPRSKNYHLEMSFVSNEYAKWISKRINKINGHMFSSKLIERRNKYVVYLKKGEEIASFLALIGAKSSCLDFEDVRITRDFINSSNRLSNIDMANMRKALNASKKQIDDINYYVEKVGWDNIKNEKLSILMHLRLDNPDASMNELSSLLSEELAATVSKSNINHLFRYIKEECERMKKDGK